MIEAIVILVSLPIIFGMLWLFTLSTTAAWRGVRRDT